MGKDNEMALKERTKQLKEILRSTYSLQNRQNNVVFTICREYRNRRKNKTMQKGMSLTQHPVKRLHAL